MSLPIEIEDQVNALMAEGREEEAHKLYKKALKEEIKKKGYISNSTNGKDVWQNASTKE